MDRSKQYDRQNFFLFVCIGFFTQFMQILTYAWHLWPLSSEGSLACHTYRAPIHNGHLRGPVTITPATERLEMELSLAVFELQSAKQENKI